jgi:hypothetical protein
MFLPWFMKKMIGSSSHACVYFFAQPTNSSVLIYYPVVILHNAWVNENIVIDYGLSMKACLLGVSG